jgi:hypothetical protein
MMVQDVAPYPDGSAVPPEHRDAELVARVLLVAEVYDQAACAAKGRLPLAFTDVLMRLLSDGSMTLGDTLRARGDSDRGRGDGPCG